MKAIAIGMLKSARRLLSLEEQQRKNYKEKHIKFGFVERLSYINKLISTKRGSMSFF